MPQATGANTSFAIDDETTYGADPGTPNTRKVYLKSCGLKVSQNKLQPETLTGARTLSKPDNGNVDAVGPLVHEVGAESLGKLLKHAFGAVTTTGAGPYVHTYSIGALPTSFVFEKDHGSAISGTGRYEKFNGCRVASMDVDMPQEGYATITFNVQAAKSTLAGTSIDATPTDNGHTPFSMASLSTIEEGGSAIATVKSIKFSLNNDVDTDGYTLGTGGVRTQLPEGQALVSGELTAVFDSAALLTKAENSTASSLKTILSRGTGDGSAGNESIEFGIDALVFERTSPPVDGPKGLVLTMSFTGYASGAMRAILKNAVATV